MTATNSSINKNPCPKDIVPYNWHQFIGKAQQQILWRDYRTFVFDVNSETLLVIFSDTFGTYSDFIWAWDLNSLWSKIIDVFNSRWWNSTTIWYTVAWWFLYVYVTWTVSNNLQMTIRNWNTGVWADGSSDPEADWLEWRVPSLFSVTGMNAKCEIIQLWNKPFDCATDKLLFISEWTQQTVNWEVFGWSEPEGVQWSNIPARDNRGWRLVIDIDTDLLGATILWPVVNTFASFSDLIAELNSMLATYWSSFRLVGNAAWNRILVTQLNWTIIVWDTDPYIAANWFNSIWLVIEDSVTGSDWLTKWTNPKGFTVSNITVWSWTSWMFIGKMPCSSIVVPTPQISILAWHGSTWANTIQFIAKYNESDRWILDYEPEIYLYFKKKKRGTNSGWRHNIRYRHKLAHSPQSLWWPSISLKADVNPRLNASTNSRKVTTERLVDGTQTDMTTQFTVSPFQFLGSIAWWDAWVWVFPISKKDWNKMWTWTAFPATLSTKTRSSQDNAKWRPQTHLVAYFKTVIRNPKWGHPIESAESYPIIIYPDVHINQNWTSDQYAHRWVNINYNTR